MTDTPAIPTAEEIAAANEVLYRARLAEQARQEAELQPLRDIIASTEFSALEEALAGLSGEIASHPRLANHINAIKNGMQGLATTAPLIATPPIFVPPSAV